jgi:hypothetical protein
VWESFAEQKEALWGRFAEQLEKALKPGTEGHEPGRVWAYFQEARVYKKDPDWERKLRMGFAQALDAKDGSLLGEKVYTLGKKYNALQRVSESLWKPTAEAIAAPLLAIHGETGGRYLTSPGLLDSGQDLSDELAAAYTRVLDSGGKALGKRPWSWASKALHFAYPLYFPILDEVVSDAWETVKRDFHWVMDMGHYENIALFYRQLWQGLAESDRKEAVERLAAELAAEFNLRTESNRPLFTALDALDKHFWCLGKDVSRFLHRELFGGQ